MTDKIEASLRMTGDNFSPAVLEKLTGWTLVRKKEVGDLTKRGKLTVGSADLCPPKEVENNEDLFKGLEWILEVVPSHLSSINKSGADDVYLDIAYYRDVAVFNLGFKPEILKKIANLNMPFLISCYGDYMD
ncbi:hypothetical protein [Gottfriedia luciferensis]|uniref:hypothetical protein n=1 Tax=Gottfriedia luciferensis TaxID=178774 RepID=UPI000B42F7E0|nr:hypothetical protein [Gottfriedia luciferensis]